MQSSSSEKATPVIEDYLQTIYSLHAEGAPVIGARLAEAMHVSAPSVTAVIHRMATEGYIKLNEHKEIFLTEKGSSAAEVMVRRHRLAERMLTDLLGMSWADVHEEAHRFEHAISSLVEQRLIEVLDSPATCPHGSPIPGSKAGMPQPGIPLDRLKPGDTAKLQRVTEKVEVNRDLLVYLGDNKLKPGATVKIVSISPWDSKMVINCQGKDVSIGLDTAAQMLMER